jgi:IMP dehydrogenase
MTIRTTRGLTFDDVLLVPQRSPIRSRGQVDVATRLTDSLRLAIPILSANMDTVTEWRMAAAMARAGGLGILHRFMTIEQQVKQVAKVKRAQGLMVENPYTVAASASVTEANHLMTQHEVGGLIVVDGDNRLIGLITRRDILLAPEELQSVSAVMTPADKIVSVGPSVTSAKARSILYSEHRLEKLPVVEPAGQHRRVDHLARCGASSIASTATHRWQAGGCCAGAAIGVGQGRDQSARGRCSMPARMCWYWTLRTVTPTTASRWSAAAPATSQMFRSSPATWRRREGARDLAEAGADAIKVGIGPGSICTTRIVTGFGVPQLTAIMEAALGMQEAGR